MEQLINALRHDLVEIFGLPAARAEQLLAENAAALEAKLASGAEHGELLNYIWQQHWDGHVAV